MATLTRVNPWSWQDAYGFSQAIEVRGASRTVYCAGQTSVDADGSPVHAGDMAAQLRQCLDNLETVLAGAGMTLQNVVRLNYYTTDVPGYLQAAAAIAERLGQAGCNPPGTLLGVAGLFHPDILVELEATAVD
ncbi:MAG TPA: RidA family protein [Steroidobacteraceae bacterium]|nr:RidA family protein [Steroidobacteraceae bacterium]